MISCLCEVSSASTPTTDPPPLPEKLKFVDLCPVTYRITGTLACLGGSIRVVSECDAAGVVTELSRVLIDAQCRVVSAPYQIIDAIAETTTEWQCENITAVFDLFAAQDTSFTPEQLIQRAIDAGAIKFPSGENVDITCMISSLEVVLLYEGSVACTDMTTAAEAVIRTSGSCINMDAGGTRKFEADCGYPIQPIESLDIAAGSGVAICLRLSNWIECVL